jgi:transposase
LEGDAAKVLQQAEAGEMFDYTDSRCSADYILKSFQVWKSEETGVQLQPEKIEQYTRRNLTKQLAEIMDSIVKLPSI